MKKLLFATLIIISFHLGSYANKIKPYIIPKISSGIDESSTTYYQLTLESMFLENERGKFEEKFKAMKSPFVINEVKTLYNINFPLFENSVATTDKVEYKIVLSEIFKEGEFERVKLRLKQDNAPFEIIEVDYKAKTVHIKLQNKIPYDQLEKFFGNIGLNVLKIEAILD